MSNLEDIVKYLPILCTLVFGYFIITNVNLAIKKHRQDILLKLQKQIEDNNIILIEFSWSVYHAIIIDNEKNKEEIYVNNQNLVKLALGFEHLKKLTSNIPIGVSNLYPNIFQQLEKTIEFNKFLGEFNYTHTQVKKDLKYWVYIVLEQISNINCNQVSEYQIKGFAVSKKIKSIDLNIHQAKTLKSFNACIILTYQKTNDLLENNFKILKLIEDEIRQSLIYVYPGSKYLSNLKKYLLKRQLMIILFTLFLQCVIIILLI